MLGSPFSKLRCITLRTAEELHMYESWRAPEYFALTFRIFKNGSHIWGIYKITLRWYLNEIYIYHLHINWVVPVMVYVSFLMTFWCYNWYVTAVNSTNGTSYKWSGSWRKNCLCSLSFQLSHGEFNGGTK